MNAATGWAHRPRCDETESWARLRALGAAGRHFDLRAAFAADPRRFAHFSQTAPHVFADLSKNLLDQAVESALFALARECGVEAWRDAMFRGEPINASEGRAALHTLLRTPAGQAPAARLAPLLDEVHAVLERMLGYAESIRADSGITDIVNIGIGGSDLGPQMAVMALGEKNSAGKRFHFVSNIDGHELAAVLRDLDPRHTLFLISSKTFTTSETMTNAASARRWFEAGGGTDVARHFVALTTNVTAAAGMGITTCFGFWDWVGGRYSLWSAIGLPIALAIGAQGFRELLAGAHAMDRHFREAPMAANLPMRLGLLDVWYRNFMGFTSCCIAPYHYGLRRLPAYLQQLQMESNGKRVDLQGRTLREATSAVLWGEPGTNGQHAFFQMLHQGSDVVPVEFIVSRQAEHALAGHHPKLLANALAQSQALMQGKTDASGHKDFPGNRPSTFYVLERLDPATLGALIALWEHRVCVSGAVWGIDSYDQWGVEFGKALARDLEVRLASGNDAALDGSTAGLLAHLRR